MDKTDYYREVIAEVLDTVGVVLFPTIVDDLAKAVATSREHESLAFHVPENPLIHQMKEVKRAHERERGDWEKVVQSKEKQIEDLQADIHYLRGRLIDAEAKLRR